MRWSFYIKYLNRKWNIVFKIFMTEVFFCDLIIYERMWVEFNGKTLFIASYPLAVEVQFSANTPGFRDRNFFSSGFRTCCFRA